MKTKAEYRKFLKQILSQMSPLELHKKSKQLSVHLNQFLNNLDVIQKQMTVGAYAPIQQEPAWYLAIDDGLSDHLAFNGFENQQMLFKKSSLNDLELRQDFGVPILSPKKTASTIVPDILLIPGLGFTEEGTRIGRGKGFYDQYLNDHKDIIKIGICFEEQILDSLVKENHDVDMDFIITDSKIRIMKRF